MRADSIAYVFITKNNIDEYIERIRRFDCGRPPINDVFHGLQNDCGTLIMFQDDSAENADNIIALCSYRCSNIRLNSEVIPAIEIMTFAVDSKYQDVFLEDMELNGRPFLLAAYILRFCVKQIESIGVGVVQAKYIILYSYQNQKVLSFYQRNGFTEFSASIRSMRNTGEHDDIYSMFRVIS
jgi:hypothetical protein